MHENQIISVLKKIMILLTFVKTPIFPQVVTITSVSPTVAEAGDEVTLRGTNFGATPAGTLVDFSGVYATAVRVVSTTELNVTVPVGARFGPISVTVNGLTASSTRFFLPTFAGQGKITQNSFADRDTFLVELKPYFVAMGDLDGDGRLDLAVADYDSTVSLLRNTSDDRGSITFAPRVDLTVGSNPLSVAMGDLDGDGKLDLAVTATDSTVSVLRNTSSPDSISFVVQGVIGPIGVVRGLRSVAIGDLIGDGKPDLVTVNPGINKIFLLRNTSSPGRIAFRQARYFPRGISVGNAPWSVAIGDLNGDGKPDLAVTNYVHDQGFYTVSVLRNQSSLISIIIEGVEDTFQVGYQPWSVAMGDLDGDGKLDLAVTNIASNSVSVLRNTSDDGGRITFAPRVDFAVGSGPRSVAIGDLDGDGKPDLAVTNASTTTVSVLGNQSSKGNLSFAPRVDFAVGSGPQSVAIGDLDGDGKPDLAVTNYDNRAYLRGYGTVSVLRNQAREVRLPIATTDPATGNPPTGARLNATVQAEDAETTVSFEYGLSTNYGNTVDAQPRTVTGTDTMAVTATLSGLNAGAVYHYRVVAKNRRGTTRGEDRRFTSNGVPIATTGPATVITPTDATLNATVQAEGESTTVSFEYGLGTNYGNTVDAQPKTVTGTDPIPVTTALSGLNAGAVYHYRVVAKNRRDTTRGENMFFTTKRTMPIVTVKSISPVVAKVGEEVTLKGANFSATPTGNHVNFNGIYADSVTVVDTTELKVTVPVGARFGPISVTVDSLTASSTHFFLPTFAGEGSLSSDTFADTLVFPAGSNFWSVAIGDLNGDRKPDLAFSNNAGNYAAVWIYLNKSRADSLTQASFADTVVLPMGYSPSSAALGDLNGDGKLDLAVPDAGVNTVFVLRNTSSDGSLAFAPRVDLTAGYSPSSVAIGDLDGDGKPDLAVTNYDSTMWVYRNTSQADSLTFALGVDLQGRWNVSHVAIGDLDGDGKPDLAVAGFSYGGGSGRVSLYRNTSTEDSLAFEPRVDLTVGGMPWFVAIGDLNGDEKLDLAVSPSGTRTVSVYRNKSSPGSLTNDSFAPKVDFTVGVRAPTPTSVAIGDLDGDGKPDLAVACPSDYVMSLLRNTSHADSLITFAEPSVNFRLDILGGSPDYPARVAIGDLNGDGKPDLVVAGSVPPYRIHVLRNKTRARGEH
ncbi:MAG: VCBS repeat-containing protein [Candidatus Marinimicrobia bacterium]|nr:VCBS repeat-containing protein [Candidatus Neomarinimicrobiota bacterium]